MKRGVLLAALMASVAAFPIFGDGPDTGVVTGTVVSSTGERLPGVTVTLKGERADSVVTTQGDGIFRFAGVVSGGYIIEAAFEGFASARQEVQVAVGRRYEFTLTLRVAAEESITVISEAPMVDKYNVTAGASLEGETAGEISTTVRSFYGALQALPGVTNDVESMDLSQSRPTVNGALWQESNVYVDGVDATYSMQGGGTRVFLPSSALAEVSMEAGGLTAEYGRNAGSHTNLITRSGTNRFHGDFAGVLSDNAWNAPYDAQPLLATDERLVESLAEQGFADPERAAAQFVASQPGERNDNEVNIEASIGGPIRRDKAWFFVSRGEVSTNQIDRTLDGQRYNNSSELFATIAKLNFQPGAKHSLATTLIDAPVDRTFLLPIMADRYTSTFFDISGDVASLGWNYAASKDAFFEAKVARQTSDENPRRLFGPEIKAADPLYGLAPELGVYAPNNNDATYFDRDEGIFYNGWFIGRGFGTNNFPRDQVNLALTQFVGADHELKYGLDLQQVRWDQNVERPDLYSGHSFITGTTFGYANGCAGVEVDPSERNDDTRCFYRDYHPLDVVAAGKGRSDSDGQNFAAYVRDRFTLGERWTFNFGARIENQLLENDRGRDVVDSTDFSPRASMVYDLNKDGKKLLTLSAGRFHTQLAQTWVNSYLQEDWNGVNAFDLREHVYSVIPALNGLDAATACATLGALVPSLVPLIDNDRGHYCLRLGSVRPGELWQFDDAGLIDVDIEPYHRDELILGFEWQFSNNWAFDAKGIYWRLDNLVGATLQRDPDFDLFLLTENYEDYADVLRGVGFVENFVSQGLGTAEQANAILDGFEDDHRRYRGLQLQLNRRFNNGWAVFNNLTVSSVEGRTYGGGNGAFDVGAFNNTDDDYGRNLEAILSEGVIAGLDCAAEGLAPTCRDDLRPFIGQPLSTINRRGDLPVDRPIIWKTYGYKIFNLGKHTFNLGGLLVWQSGSPWQKTRAADNDVSILNNAANTDINTFLVPRGSFDNPDFWWLNLSGAWNFPLGRESLSGQLRLEITNVTNEQELVATSSRTGTPLRSRRSFQQPQKIRLLGAIRF